MSSSTQQQTVDLFNVVKEYLDRMLPIDGSMKALLLDEETLDTVATVYGQTQLLDRGVFLVDRLDNLAGRGPLPALRAVVYIRPTATSVAAAGREFKAGNFSSYTVSFSNALPMELLNELAASDTHDRVVRVEEVFADFTCLNRDLLMIPTTRAPKLMADVEETLGAAAAAAAVAAKAGAKGDNVTAAAAAALAAAEEESRSKLHFAATGFALLPPPAPLCEQSLSYSPAYISRVSQGLCATFLAMRRRPLIRYYGRSGAARRVVAEMQQTMRGDAELFNFAARDTVLLVLDRVEDCVTPLLLPWTYQAMLNELVGMHNNRLVLPPPAAGSAKAEESGFVFSQRDDSFFAENMYATWGEVCQRARAFADRHKESTQLDKSTSMAELKRFMQDLHKHKSVSTAVAKHVTVMSRLSECIKARSLYDVGAFEQRMLQESSQNDHWAQILEFAKRIAAPGTAASGGVHVNDVVRLCLLFHLKYEKSAAQSRAADLIRKIDPDRATIIERLRAFVGDRDARQMMFGSEASSGLFAVSNALSGIVKGLSDERNILTQHDPLLKRQLAQLMSNKLDTELYPYVAPPTNPNFRPREVIICILGGCTLEEAALIGQANVNPGVLMGGGGSGGAAGGGGAAAAAASSLTGDEMRLVLAAPHLLNSRSFLDAVMQVRLSESSL